MTHDMERLLKFQQLTPRQQRDAIEEQLLIAAEHAVFVERQLAISAAHALFINAMVLRKQAAARQRARERMPALSHLN